MDTPQERASVRKGMYHDKCRIQISGFGEDTAGEWKRVLARGIEAYPNKGRSEKHPISLRFRWM
ncbi:hypothetical protein TIFTF001_049274 [Ficus carica]|uniref:Uncharacterized protein n=1 Tax=Ficus carica TaxID=3494 RepID=A0AA87YXZ0_FICCA|nr:hypothetical protein TIFTF001_049274 [Ficus carica]